MMLIHTCCADCSLKIIDSIKHDPKMDNEECHLYYYNPNIHPQSEFTARQIALSKIATENNIKLIIANWTPGDYFSAVNKLDQTKIWDSSTRCPICWQVRLEKTFKYAKENCYNRVTTTLLTSKYMQKGVILKIGCDLAKSTGIDFYSPEEVNCQLSTRGFYKQNYCGCAYSLITRMKEKYAGSVGNFDN
jgi:epoxyqueuosine reductase